MHDERERYLIRYVGGFAPFTVARAEGAWLETTDGRRILDFTSGQICSTLGHNHPRIAAAIRRALDETIHLNSWIDRKSTRLNSSHIQKSRMPSSA